ncbi:MAG: DEAD/DEAH box helicase family protein [Hyphomicrobium sp.]|nr:DEAD/DEAH box helicase family protein [Hyphomicrobium sp.]
MSVHSLAVTPYHAKFLAYDLTLKHPAIDPARLSMSLFDAAVDLNPHQIEAALFALNSPLTEGVILADEVGLGKTIEAGIVLCQKWAERKRRLLVVCPASIRKQWALELAEKFSLPAVVVDAGFARDEQRRGNARPFEQAAIVIASYHYAARMKDALRIVPWDLIVIDEAHKLRNAYRTSNKVGQALKWATEGRKKLLLTATPLQNSLMELYGLASLIDENMFGDPNAFRARYANAGGDLAELRQRLSTFCKRTLRRQVLEYVKYTRRIALTRPFRPTDTEQALYDSISAFLQRDGTYAIPARQRHLTVLILRKLLASSSLAIAGTLEALRDRLASIADGRQDETQLVEALVSDEEMEEELLDEWLELDEDDPPNQDATAIDPKRLRDEIDELAALAKRARSIGTDTKTTALLTALEVGFSEQMKMGAARKALVFTESRRTQEYLRTYLEANGYAGKIVVFSGSNTGPQAAAIYEQWLKANKENGKSTGSRAVDMRTALVEHFRDHADIMIATEAAAEGVNLQFCSQVINYDLPWNPQRIEQRIGRCHRYGQKHDVIVINFLNERNAADQRVHELLTEKFQLFDGVFGASDDVLGIIESGVDFEKRVLAIYQECRTPQAIEAAFKALQAELDEQIKSRLEETKQTLLEHFDEDVHARLKLRLAETSAQLDAVGKKFWNLTKFVLNEHAAFDDEQLHFDLATSPQPDISTGRYHLITKSRSVAPDDGAGQNRFLYRLSHPLGESVIAAGKATSTPTAEISFDVSNHPGRIAVLEALRGKGGHLTLQRLTVQSFETEEYLLFSGIDENGKSVDHETCSKLFAVSGATTAVPSLPEHIVARLSAEADRHAMATVSRSLEANSKHFNVARERLEQWADDKIQAAEKALKDTKEQIKALRRDARLAETLEAQHQLQQKLQDLEKRQRKQRQEIFKVEDEIESKRDELIAGLEKRLSQSNHTEALFTIRWSVV